MKIVLLVIRLLLLVTSALSCTQKPWSCPAHCECESHNANCRDTNLVKIPTAPAVDFIENFDLSFNLFTIMSNSSFSGYGDVETLLLMNNKVQKIEAGAFASLRRLRTLDLSHNLLKTLPDNLFVHNLGLEWVSLQDNLFTEVPYIPLPLSHLDLSRCKISTIRFQVHLKVQFLDLSHNLLSTLTAQNRESLSKIDAINLSDNQWICGRQFFKTMCWSFNRFAGGVKKTPMKCFSKKGEEVYTLSQQLMRCNKDAWIETTAANNSTSFTQTTEVESVHSTTSQTPATTEQQQQQKGRGGNGGKQVQKGESGGVTHSVTLWIIVELVVLLFIFVTIILCKWTWIRQIVYSRVPTVLGQDNQQFQGDK